MRKFLAISLLLATSVVFADVSSDLLIGYTASRDDRYGANDPIVGQAWYALVWTPAGKTFGGFTSGGRLSNPKQDDLFNVVLLAPGESCLFEISKADVTKHSKQKMAVYLLDTRDAHGVVAGLNEDTGLPSRVSRWGLAAQDSVTYKVCSSNAGLLACEGGSEIKSDLSEDDGEIKITNIGFEGDEVVLDSEGGSENCSYAVATAASMSELVGKKATESEQNGNGKNRFRMKLGAGSSSARFYILKRTR